MRTLQSQISNALENDVILSVIIKNAKTLTTLELEIADEDAIESTNEGKRLDGIELRKLENLGLKLCGYGGPGFEMFATIRMLQCPGLTNLSVDFNNTRLGRPFFHCLSHQKQLRRLEIANVDAVACELVEYFRNMSQGTLRHIALNSSKTITDEVLYALAGTRSLLSIRISDASAQFVTEEGLTSFFRKLRSIPRLKLLYLTSIPYMTDSRIAKLARLKELRVLGLFYLPDVTLRGVYALKFKSGSLKTVNAYKCNNLNHNTDED
ncbi:hypothetical protein BJV82DRAFT_629813 [Fennellomyces sp. T-0311]|nr:hypothetical protein BJV82DRAFT_629813 [Fennellomyces sp. T-0311]